MAMFDLITVHRLGDTNFQTKSFDQDLDQYHVDENDTLTLNKTPGKWTVKDGSMTVIFYAYSDTQGWLEYRAFFESGRMILLEKLQQDGNSEWKPYWRHNDQGH